MTGRSIIVYSRRGCHLCEQLIDELLPLVRDGGRVRVVDIDEQDETRRAYDERVPVLEIDGRVVCEGRLDRAALLQTLSGG